MAVHMLLPRPTACQHCRPSYTALQLQLPASIIAQQAGHSQHPHLAAIAQPVHSALAPPCAVSPLCTIMRSCALA